MPIISIQRDTNSNVCFVRIISTDNLATVGQANYIADNQEAINALNGGIFGWFMSDMLLVAASNGNALFQFTDDTFASVMIYGEQGSGTVNPGLINEVAFYPANGTSLDGIPTANNGVLITSSGGVPSIASALPSAVQLNITSVGILNAGTWNATPVTVPFGGTGNTTFTAYSVICAGTTATGTFQNVSGVGTSGQILTSNGAGLLPTWQPNPASGTINTGNQNDLPYYSASPSGTTLSPIAGAASSVLITSGLGVPTLSQTLPSAVQLNITSVGTVTAGTWHAGVIGSTYGGTGIANPTAHGIMVAEGSSAMTPIVLSSGQILIGSTGIDPVAAAINSGTGILVGNGPGSITVSLASASNNTIKSNISGISAAPVDNTLTAIIDSAIGSTQGNILYRNATAWTVLAPGTSGNFLRTNGAGADPSWAAEAGTGTVTSVGSGTGLTGGPITTTGTLSFAAIGAHKLWANVTGSSAVPSEIDTSTFIQSINTQIITSTGTYTPTTGTKFFIVEVQGSGGGGGGAQATSGQSGQGGGGGGGGYVRKLFNATEMGASASVTIGAAGSGGSAGANNGTAGGDVVFDPAGSGVTLTGGGGSFGFGMNQTATTNSTPGGAGGTATNGDLNLPGGQGEGGVVVSGTAGVNCGGGGGASTLGRPQGNRLGGGGSYNGTIYGGGGAGGEGNSGSNVAGGNGAIGVVIVTEFIAL